MFFVLHSWQLKAFLSALDNCGVNESSFQGIHNIYSAPIERLTNNVGLVGVPWVGKVTSIIVKASGFTLGADGNVFIRGTSAGSKVARARGGGCVAS